jgi:hypothetical protein
MTTLPFIKFSSHSWLRAWKAWCPQCYDEWCFTDAILYDPLLCSIKAVSTCPVHLSPLIDICPACNGRYRPLTNGATVARCGRCHLWLGKSSKVTSFISTTQSPDEFAIWPANQIGALLATVPTLPSSLDTQPLNSMLCEFLKQNPCGSQDVLSNLFGITRRSLNTWSSGFARPRLGGLCRLSFRLGISLLELIQGNISISKLSTLLESSHFFEHRQFRRPEIQSLQNPNLQSVAPGRE